MKSHYILSAIFCMLLALAACKPSNNNNATPNTEKDFRLEGIRDLSIGFRDLDVMRLDVKLSNSEAEQITLTVANLPVHISCHFDSTKGTDSITSIAPYSKTVYFRDSMAKEGIYHAIIKCSDSSGKTKEYPFTVNVLPKICSGILSGPYIGGRYCGGPSVYSTIYLSVDKQNDKKMYFEWDGSSAYLIVDCNTLELTIPEQDLKTMKISGSGKFEELKEGRYRMGMDIHQTLFTDNTTQTCVFSGGR